MEKLDNCPFCGSDKCEVKMWYGFIESLNYVQCYGCGANSAVFSTKEEAVVAWNKRSDKKNTEV